MILSELYYFALVALLSEMLTIIINLTHVALHDPAQILRA